MKIEAKLAIRLKFILFVICLVNLIGCDSTDRAAGGVLFIAATKDEKLRAFHMKTGKLLWETRLPAGGYATPATYEVNGKQYLVIACGGGKMGTKSGATYVTFALPK